MIPNKATYRTTPQKKALLSLLRSTKAHPTAAWLFDRLRLEMPDVSQGTVYRNLSVLAEEGVIRVLRNGSAQDRFDADVSEHYHVICESCGKVEDISVNVRTDANSEAERASGYEIHSHRLDFYGVCPDCQRRAAVGDDAE